MGDSEPMRRVELDGIASFCSQRLFIFSPCEKIKGFFVASITERNKKRKALPSFFCFWWTNLRAIRTNVTFTS